MIFEKKQKLVQVKDEKQETHVVSITVNVQFHATALRHPHRHSSWQR